jgi:hypothetical protein
VAECAVIAREDDLKGQFDGAGGAQVQDDHHRADLQQQLTSRIRETNDDPGVIPEIIELLRNKKMVK